MPDRCNENGVYEPDEVFTLDRDVKGWRGVPNAEIELRDLGTHWIWSASFALFGGDHLGSFHPLHDDDERHRAPDRGTALYCARAELARRLTERAKEPGDARRIMVWLDTLSPRQGSLF